MLIPWIMQFKTITNQIKDVNKNVPDTVKVSDAVNKKILGSY